MDYTQKTKITINEINDFVIGCFKKMMDNPTTVPDSLPIIFSDRLETIDELFYAYLLLFKQSFPKCEINLIIPNQVSDGPYWRARHYVAYLNVYLKNKIKINGVAPVTIKISESFIPPILVKKNNKGEPMGFESYQTDILKDEIGKLKIDLSMVETEVAEDIKAKLNDKNALTHSYRIELLEKLGVLKYYLTGQTDDRNSEKEIVDILERNNFFKCSQVELFFFYLLVIHFGKINLKKDYRSTLSYLFEKTNKIYFGLKELAKNIIEHTEDGIGVISARVHTKDKIDVLKNFGGSFDEWFKTHEGDKDVSAFLDINVVDMGRIGVTENYITKITKEKAGYIKKQDEAAVYTDLADALAEDINQIREKRYGFSHFLNYEKISLLHQVKRINARIGLLIFSSLVCRDEKGIVKAASTNAEGKAEGAYFYHNDSLLEGKLEEDHAHFIKQGTNYNFILPIVKKIRNKAVKLPDQGKIEQGVPTSLLNKLVDYQKINLNENHQLSANKTYVVELKEPQLKFSTEKYEKILELGHTVRRISESYTTFKNNGGNEMKKPVSGIILINANLLANSYTSSDWMRFLANTQSFNPVPIIVYDMDRRLYDEIIEINKIFALKNFWIENSAILFYFKHNYKYEYLEQQGKTQELSLWFCNVLCGNTYEDYLALNKQISHYQHNLYSIQESGEVNNYPLNILIGENPLFQKDGDFLYLLNFELLICSGEDGLTLFEQSVFSLLNLEIRTLPDRNLIGNKKLTKEEQFFYKFKGYKISNSHFRLGSKLHISDYYYAKRLFYNSFYANRFAFLISRYLLENVFNTINQKRDITLVGYSRYSELLVSNVRRLLEKRLLGIIKINHDVILEDNKVLKKPDEIKNDIIIIVPISTTFSTSIKIKKALTKVRANLGHKSPNILGNKVINALFVADQTFKNDYTPEVDGKWEASFGWKIRNNEQKKDVRKNKVIPVENYYQKYFITLYSVWYLNHECALCFPLNTEEEKCLLETGTSSVSPESIFGFPVTRLDKNCDKNILYNQYFDATEREVFLLKKHVCRDKKHYRHYIKVDMFLEKPENKEKIGVWLKELKEEYLLHGKDKKIIIITPSRTANSGFVNMVNEHIFSETATVLQYSETDDILQNFVRFNASFFEDATIIFVDDVIHTAKVFHKINNYIKNIPTEVVKAVDYCIFLFNRTSYFEHEEIKRNLSAVNTRKEIFSYAEINLPSVQITNHKFPDEERLCLFDKLSDSSVTDMMKLYFLELKDSVTPFDFDNDLYYPKGNRNDLFHFFVFKSLYSFFFGEFKNSSEFSYANYDEIQKFVTNKTELLNILVDYIDTSVDIKGFVDYFLTRREINYTKEEIKTKIIYICSTAPFSYYKDIREFAFYWVLQELRSIVQKIYENKENKNFFEEIHNRTNNPHSFFEKFKLYLRLASELKINYIFSIDMLKAINILLNNWSDGGIEKKGMVYIAPQLTGKNFNFEKSELRTLKKSYDIGFITYYLGIVEQLTKEDEAKAIEVIQNIAEIVKTNSIERRPSDILVKDMSNLTLRNNFNNKFVDLLRNMVFESTFIFNTFIDNFREDSEKKLESYSFDSSDNNFGSFTHVMKEYYKENQTARWQSLKMMLSEYDDDLKPQSDEKLETAFYKTVYLKTLLQNDKNKKQVVDTEDIQGKTKIILTYLSEILGINESECERGGGYFTTHYRNHNLPEKEITEDDLYTISRYAADDKDDNLKDLVLTDETSLVYDLYKGIKEKNSRKPVSLVELIYDNGKYVSSHYQEYHQEESIHINDKLETYELFEHKYNNLLFLRITDINKDEKFHEVLEKYIEQLKNNPNDIFNKEDVINELRNECISLNLQIKLEDELKKDSGNEAIKDILLKYNRKNAYRSKPLAVLAFYKCRLDNGKQCSKYKNGSCTAVPKRFDPKRIRFLLLLRDDILEFVKRHLKNDSFSMYVDNTKREAELHSPDHNYNNNLADLSIALSENDIDKIDFIYGLIYHKRHIRNILERKNFLLNLEKKEINNISVKSEIDNYAKFILSPTPYELADLSGIPDNLILKFPLFIFREILYEYIRNVEKILRFPFSFNHNIKRILIIGAEQLNDDCVKFYITNNFTNKEKKFERVRDTLDKKGYIKTMSVKGLYLNYKLLTTMGFEKPMVLIKPTDNEDISLFIVEFKIKNQYGKSNS